MTHQQAKRIIVDAKFKAAAIAAESPSMGKAAIAEVEAMERELAIEMQAQTCDECGNWLIFTTDPDDGAVKAGCLCCDIEVLMP